MHANDSLEVKFWKKCLQDNMVVVCTPAILQQCLGHSLVRMEQINLLIFDEAHHAKGDSPYAKIMDDFYPQPLQLGGHKQPRPRIFGMTASPIDARSDLILTARFVPSRSPVPTESICIHIR